MVTNAARSPSQWWQSGTRPLPACHSISLPLSPGGGRPRRFRPFANSFRSHAGNALAEEHPPREANSDRGDWQEKSPRKPEGPAGAAHSMRASAQVTAPGAVTSMIVAVSTRPNRQNRSTCSRMSVPIAFMPPAPCEPVHMRCAPKRRTRPRALPTFGTAAGFGTTRKWRAPNEFEVLRSCTLQRSNDCG
jgi:hypothetical protein